MELILDDGLQFGLGLFETVAVEDGKPVLLPWHMERLKQSMEIFGIPSRPIEEELNQYITSLKKESSLNHHALKIVVTKENLFFTIRESNYKPSMYETGFQADFSEVYRNETSPLIYHKTMNYGDCILEKRAASAKGFQERIFLNSKGEICEGTVSNIFFVQDDKLLTPKKSSGLLPGIMRRFVLASCSSCGLQPEECSIRPEDLGKIQECFVTNSLMGIMPVHSLGIYRFSQRTYTTRFMDAYSDYLKQLHQDSTFVL